MESDLIGLDGGLNIYVYVGFNLVGLVDFNGLSFIVIVGVGVGFVVGGFFGVVVGGFIGFGLGVWGVNVVWDVYYDEVSEGGSVLVGISLGIVVEKVREWKEYSWICKMFILLIGD